MDESLRHEVRFLTTRLGAMVQEQCGARVFSAIENLRKLSKQIRQNPASELLEENRRRVYGLTLRQASDVAHAFSLFFHLVNLCEERQRVRRLRAYAKQESGAPMSLRYTFSELRRNGVAWAQLSHLLASAQIEPVLTAHPTEAKRRSVINHILRISRELDSLDSGLGPEAERSIDPWIEALWLTDEVRQTSLTPEVEIENTIVYLEKTIYDLATSFWENFCQELVRFAPRTPPPPFLRFGSWAGTDRDGNPNVTPQTSLQAAEHLRSSILKYYRQSCERLLAIVSLPCRNGALERSLRQDMRQFPATRAFQNVDQPNEFYRRKVRVMIWRLERAAERAPGGYGSPEGRCCRNLTPSPTLSLLIG